MSKTQDPTRVLFETADLRAGTFEAAPGHPQFVDSGPAKNHLMVFPSSAVWISDSKTRAFVADPNLATFYNRGHLYRRRPLSPEGDRSFWIAPSRRFLNDLLGHAVPRGQRNAPFSWRLRYVSPSVFRLQRALRRYLLDGSKVDAQLVTEAASLMLNELLLVGAPCGVPLDRSLSERTKELLDERFSEPLLLAQIAEEVGCSRFHLARVFRAGVGVSIHQYRDQLRLRTALIRLPATRNLAALALDLGYDSHSHFTSRFRRAFGIPPAYIRDAGFDDLALLIARTAGGTLARRLAP